MTSHVLRRGAPPGERVPDQAQRTAPRDVPAVPWRTLAEARGPRRDAAAVRPARVLLQVGVIAALVLALVMAGSVVLARQIAEREAINAAASSTDVLAESVVQVALEDALLSATPEAARARLDEVVRERVLAASGVLRVKLWSAAGVVVYSDEPRLIGQVFPLEPEELEVLFEPRIEAEVTDVDRPENAFERGQGKLLEVYRPVWTPGGQSLLFETYTQYDAVDARTGQLWRGFAGLLASSLLLLVVLLLPLLWTLLDRLRSGQRLREALLHDAVDASARERERIAATLHDGIVQELVGTSLTVVPAAGQQARAAGSPELAEQLQAAARTVRTSIGGLRSLLVDIYPPSLRTAGLPGALADLAALVRGRQTQMELDLADDALAALTTEGEQLVFRVAQETLRNAVAHSGATRVLLRLYVEGGKVVLEVADDGVGFDADLVASEPEPGHLGLRLLPDLARSGGAALALATAPGAGTRWRLQLPTA